MPHAPNAAKTVKKSAHSVGSGGNALEAHDTQIIHESTFHLINDPTQRHGSAAAGERRHRFFARAAQTRAPLAAAYNDWEKVYDLPLHTSTITARDLPTNVSVQRRLEMLARSSRSGGGGAAHRRSRSAHFAPPPEVREFFVFFVFTRARRLSPLIFGRYRNSCSRFRSTQPPLQCPLPRCGARHTAAAAAVAAAVAAAPAAAVCSKRRVPFKLSVLITTSILTIP